MVRLALSVTAAVLLVMSAEQVSAQQPKAGAPSQTPVGTDPAATSATYGDWVFRCARVGEGDKAKRACEVALIIRLQNQNNPIGEIALGRPPGETGLHLTAVLPASVSFPSTVQLVPSEKGARTVDLQWRRCLPGACFAETPMAEDMVRGLRGLTDAAKLTFKDAGGRDVALPVSFRGFAQALDALGKS